MKILLFGKGGQVGWELQRSVALLGDVVALDSCSKSLCGDFTNLEGLIETVRSVAPDVIINAAAYTAVDKAETDIDLAHKINASAPETLAREAKALNAWLVHYSTDYVFNGSGQRPWVETDRPEPLSVYGRSKFEGEQAIRLSGCRHLIFRTSWVYGTRGGNFAKTMLRLAEERDTLNVINDQIGSPTGAELLADATAHAIKMALVNPTVSGLYHLAAAGETSWHGYASFILDLARQAGIKLKVEPENIKSIPSSSYPTPAQRPMNSRLDTSHIRKTFGFHLPDWQAGVRRTISQIVENKL